VSRTARPWLAPLVPLYRLALGARALSLRTGLASVERLHWPVVSVGSLSAGGAGKTPLVLALARALTRACGQGGAEFGANRIFSGAGIAILSRGYGRASSTPARVDPHGAAADFGDEPLLLAQAGFPVYVAARRILAGRLAEREAETRAAPESAMPPRRALSIHLLDDGFQHRQLHRDADIVLFSRHDLDDRLLPAGNLREPRSALRRASILAVPSEDAALATGLEAGLEAELRWTGPVWRLRRRMEIPPLAGPALAFCGIARPEQFFAGLEAAGVSLAARFAFPDHHRYTPADLARLAAAAKTSSAKAFLTTEKDRVRLGLLTAQLTATLPLAVATLHIEIEDEGVAIRSLLNRLAPHLDT
jgi:tetraacyldisaccharide 4'-kinase